MAHPPSNKPLMWMLLSDTSRADLHLVIPSLAWMAEDVGAVFECYLESPRSGELFAQTGSTILGGYHHHAFNYLNAAFNVQYILLGSPSVFASTIKAFGAAVLAQAETPCDLYAALLKQPGVNQPKAVIAAPTEPVAVPGQREERINVGAYLSPEILFRRALAIPSAQVPQAETLITGMPDIERCSLFLPDTQQKELEATWPEAREIDRIQTGDDIGAITLRIAQRWKHAAGGVVFGDPPVVLSQLAAHCRERKVAVFAPRAPLPPEQVHVSAYTEAHSPIARAAGQIASEIGNRVLVGRQTADGELFEWSKQGVCIQIVDPNRPAFPSVAAVHHAWAPSDRTLFDLEPDDAQLRQWMDEGKVLATLIWHSGEVAHNEAMLNLIELAGRTGVKMGIGVHAQRYESCPQLWELINVPRERGGARGLIEPVLHSGGLGVLAECNCPPHALAAHCQEALSRIEKITGRAGRPLGYYAFMDSDLATLTRIDPAIYQAIELAGLEYVISSAMPGRNRIVHRTSGCVVINQSCRVVHGASPFVRITTADDLNTSGHTQPGWLIGTLDAPVVAFMPYIWRHGWKLMQIIERLTRSPQFVNVTPRTIARYARMLADRGIVPIASPNPAPKD